jgi:hypothetical protein
MQKRFVFHILLFAFSFLLIPTSYWHECEQDHETHKTSRTAEVKIKQAHCFVCDFHLFPIETTSPLTLKFSKNIFLPEAASCCPVESSGLFSENLRGPPLT